MTAVTMELIAVGTYPLSENFQSRTLGISDLLMPNFLRELARNPWVGCRRRAKRFNFAHARKGASHVRNGDGTPDDQRDVERVNNFVARPAFLGAANKVISDAIVAAKNRGGDESEEFLGLGAERAGLVGLMVQREETLHAKVAAAKDFFV